MHQEKEKGLQSQHQENSIQVGDGLSDFPVDDENRRHGIYRVSKETKRPWRRIPSGIEWMFLKYNAEAEFEHGVQKGPVKFWINEREDQADLRDRQLIFDENKPGEFELK